MCASPAISREQLAGGGSGSAASFLALPQAQERGDTAMLPPAGLLPRAHRSEASGRPCAAAVPGAPQSQPPNQRQGRDEGQGAELQQCRCSRDLSQHYVGKPSLAQVPPLGSGDSGRSGRAEPDGLCPVPTPGLSYGSQQDEWEPGSACCCSHKEKPLSVKITLEHLTGSLRNPKEENCTPRCCN